MMVLASIVIAVLWAVLRYASDYMHPLYIVFWRSLFGALLLAPWFMRNGVSQLKTTRLPLHFLRSFFGVLAMTGIFYSIATIPLAEAMAINYSGPLFATLGAVLFLGERIRARRIAAVLIGFAGMLVVVRPGLVEVGLGVGAAILGAVAMAGSLLSIKKLSETEANQTIIVYGNLLCLPLAFLLALAFWQWPTWELLGLLLAIALLSTAAQLCLNRALALAEASAVLPVDFLRLVFVTVLGIVLFGQEPGLYIWIGAAIILASTVYIARREAVAGRNITGPSRDTG